MKDYVVLQKEGLADLKGNVIIPVKYKKVEQFREGIFLAKDFCGYYHFYTEKGQINVNFLIEEYKENPVLEGAIIVRTDKDIKIIEIDMENNIINVLCEGIVDINTITEGMILAFTYNERIVYSISDKKIIFRTDKYDEVRVDNGLIKVRKFSDDVPSGQYEGIYDFSSKEIIKCEWAQVVICKNKYIKVINYDANGEKLYGVFDREGNMLVECEYRKIEKIVLTFENQSYDFFIVNNDNCVRLIPVDIGITELFFSKNDVKIKAYNGNVICVREGNKEILYKAILQKKYVFLKETFVADTITPLNTDLYRIYIDKKYGICNVDGEVVLPIEYRRIIVGGDGQILTIDNSGEKKFFN